MLTELLKKRKIITLEVLPPLDADPSSLAGELQPLKALIDAVNLPSNPLGKLRTDPLCFGHVLQEILEVQVVPHFVARHLTLLGFESLLLGAHSLGIKNILCVTGDTPLEGRSMYELNSAKLLKIGQSLKTGLTSSRRSIKPLSFCLCTSLNPNVPNLYGEFIKSGEKWRNGAEVFFTQPVFNADKFIRFVQEFRGRFHGAPVIAGLSFLHTKKRAFSLMKFLGIPYEYINLIEERDETDMLYEIARQIKDYVDGFYLIPIAKYSAALPLVEKIRKLIG
jgi:5,10-methylenetetrahydrofolate reductase